MKLLLLTLLLAVLPLTLAYYLHATSPAPTTRYLSGRCTRYCTLHGCRHATRANSPAYFRLRPLYRATVRGLMVGGRGLYAAANVAFYLVLIPGLLVWLACGALRDAGTIRQLRRQQA